jgi:hypothetical protein
METSPENPPKYIMATILMPIQVNNLEEDDFICLQEHAKVSLEFCKELPVAKEGEGYGGLADKIHALYANYRESEVEVGMETEVVKKEEEELEKGVVGLLDSEVAGKWKHPKRAMKHNITYRSFRENQKSHRYTFRNLS